MRTGERLRIVLVFFAVVVALYATAVGALALFQRRMIYPGAFEARVRGARPPMPAGFEVIPLTTADEEHLFALWRAPRPGCGVVLTFHGNASQPEWHAEQFADEPWRSGGWGALAIAYRGYGGSTGAPSEAGLIADGAAARAEIERRVPGAPVLLHGHSLGAAVAVAVGTGAARLGLYLEAPFDSMAAVVRLLFPYVPSALLRDTWRSDLRIAGQAGPVLIVHGDVDPVVALTLGRRLAQAAGPATRFVALEGDHVSILGRLDREAEALFRRPTDATCAAMPPAPVR